jgi:hypothetical protein
MSASMWTLLVALSIAPLVVWLGTAAINWTARGVGRSPSPQMACFGAGFATMGGLVVLFLALQPTGGDRRELVAGLVFTAAYGFCVNFLNWFVFTVTETSMHAHLLVEIGREPEIARAELDRRYNKTAIIAARVPRLIELGQLRLEAGRLYLKGSWVLTSALALRLLRRLLGIPPTPPQDDTAPAPALPEEAVGRGAGGGRAV